MLPLSALGALLLVSWFTIDCPEEEAKKYPGGIVLRDSAGEVLRVSLGPGDVDCRPWYKADDSDWIVKALVASEDGSFYSHHGVNLLSVFRAVCQNVVGRRRVSGASTITMQAVRLIAPHPKSYAWKFREAIMALKLERAHDKHWILSQYLNRAPFGSNLVGIEAAARGWFGKGAKELGLGEAAMLAGMVQAPSRFRPDRGYERALARRDYVLGRMLKLGIIDKHQLAGARSVRPEICRAKRPYLAPHYCDRVLRGLNQLVSADITTPLDADLQERCEDAVNNAAANGIRVSSAVMKVSTGELVALAVSGDYFDAEAGQVDTASTFRSSGSTLKPFLAALALDEGYITPDGLLLDSPLAVKGYRPENFDGKFRGRVSLKDSLVESLNLPFVRLLNDVGINRFTRTLSQLGFSRASQSEYGLGLVIGEMEVSLIELVGAYRYLATDGYFTPEARYLVSEMLSGGERSAAALGHVADVALPSFAWKTGTSSAYRDAWTIAWNQDYVIGVWCGHLRGNFGDESVVGAKVAAPVAWSIARGLYPNNDGPRFVQPAGIVRREACPLSGELAGADCPHRFSARFLASAGNPSLCHRHIRGPEGPKTLGDDNEHLAITKPSDGAVFRVTDGDSVRVTFAAIGEGSANPLTWYRDGKPIGEGRDVFVIDFAPGEHAVTCAAQSGETASVTLMVKR